MRLREVETMAADPRIRALRRSERDVWCYLAWQADDDGVVRRYIATRHLAGKTGYAQETVRKAVHRLEKLDLLRVNPGIGRTCSLYAVPASLSTTIMEPQAPAARARAAPQRAADPRRILPVPGWVALDPSPS